MHYLEGSKYHTVLKKTAAGRSGRLRGDNLLTILYLNKIISIFFIFSPELWKNEIRRAMHK
jgi:hypothetical protein